MTIRKNRIVLAALVVFLATVFGCEKNDQSIDADFYVKDVRVEYSGMLTKNLIDSSEVIVDSSGVLIYTFAVKTAQELKQVSVHGKYWGQSLDDSRFFLSLGEYFANDRFNNDSISFQVRMDLSANPDTAQQSIYPSEHYITLQAFTDVGIYDGATYAFTIVADSTLAR